MAFSDVKAYGGGDQPVMLAAGESAAALESQGLLLTKGHNAVSMGFTKDSAVVTYASANGFSVGDAFVDEETLRLYEIKAFVANVSYTLASPYVGTTGARLASTWQTTMRTKQPEVGLYGGSF